MASPDIEFLLNGAAGLVTAGIYAYVGRIMWRRPLVGEARTASRLFGVWWAALGIMSALVGVYLLPGAFGFADLAYMVTLLYVAMILIVVALWGLVYYLLYLYTGNARLFWPISIAYGTLGVGLVYLITWMNPIAYERGAYSARLVFENPLSGAPAVGMGLLISVPALLAAVAYASLWFQVEGRSERFRIGLVSVSFAAWFGWSLLSTLLQLGARFPDSLALLVVNRAFGLAAPLLVLLAFRPPASWRARWGLRAVDTPQR